MKAIAKKRPERGLQVIDVPPPQPQPHEVLIRPIKTAICGTDLHIYQWDKWAQATLHPPVIIGHEFVGRIEAVGTSVETQWIGKRVAGEGHLTCGQCKNCRKGHKHLCSSVKGLGVQCDGCFAPLFTLPQENLFSIPQAIDDSTAAIFDPFGNAVHSSLSAELAGEDVLITGAGPIGLMCLRLAKHLGARQVTVTDITSERLALARKMGADHTFHASNFSPSQLSSPFSVGLEMSGSPQALQTMIDGIEYGGHIALLGILPQECQVDWTQVIFKALTLQGIYGRKIFETWYKMVAFLESGLDLSPVITHELPAQNWEEGFQIMEKGACGKVILDWEQWRE